MKGAKNMSEIQNAIEVKNLKKGFGGRVLFENFSLNVKANTIHAIIGPNGSGKTTLLRLITGVYQPNAGTINIAGKYAMQLENDYLYEEQTGLENLRIFGKYFGFEINDRSDSYCTQLGLTEHLGKRVSTYSKGMKRKLSLLIVIMIGRDILLMDEPTSGVDPISRVEIRSLIEALKADGKTVIITSHDLSEIEKCADDVSMIKNGRLLFDKGIQEMQGQSFIFFAGEISKDMLQQEKITKRIEWKLANGIKISSIVKENLLSLWIGTLILLFPLLLIISIRLPNLILLLGTYFLILSILYSAFINVLILWIRNMNWFKSIPIFATLLHILLVVLKCGIFMKTNKAGSKIKPASSFFVFVIVCG